MTGFLKGWQESYDAAIGKGGRVVNVYADEDRWGGRGIDVVVKEGGQLVIYSPFYDQNPDGDGEDEDGNVVREDLAEWLDSMTGNCLSIANRG